MEISLSSPTNQLNPIPQLNAQNYQSQFSSSYNQSYPYQNSNFNFLDNIANGGMMFNEINKYSTQLMHMDSSQDAELKQFENKMHNVSNYLNELVKEQEQYNYFKPSIAKQVAQSIGNEITQFSNQLLEQKMNQPRGLHDIPTGTIGLQLNTESHQLHAHTTAIQEHLAMKGKKQDQKDRNDLRDQILNEKLDWIRLKKKIEDITDLDPSSINIESIFNLPSNIKVKDDDEDSQTVSLYSDEQLQIRFNNFKSQILEEVTEDQSISKKRKQKQLTVITQIFSDKLDQSSQILTKDQINPISTNVLIQPQASIAGYNLQPSVQITDPSHQSINNLDQAEIVDINFYRDLAPSARTLAQPLSKEMNNRLYKKEERKRRVEQKRILNDLVEIEPSQQNLDDDMYLFAISGQAPFDKLVERMNGLSKWVVKESSILNEIYNSDSSNDLNNSSSVSDDSNQNTTQQQSVAEEVTNQKTDQQQSSKFKTQQKNAQKQNQNVRRTVNNQVQDSLDNVIKNYQSQSVDDNNQTDSLQNFNDYSYQVKKMLQQHKNRFSDQYDSVNSKEEQNTYDSQQQQFSEHIDIEGIVDKMFAKQHKQILKQPVTKERKNSQFQIYEQQNYQKTNQDQAIQQRKQSDQNVMKINKQNKGLRKYSLSSSSSDDIQQLQAIKQQQQQILNQRKEKQQQVVPQHNIQKQVRQKSRDKQQQKQQMLQYQESLGQIRDECEFTVTEKLQTIEELIGAKNEIIKNITQIKEMTSKKKATQLQQQSLKNNEKMRQEIVKRIEKHLLSIVQVIDQKTQEAKQAIQDSLSEETLQILSTQTVLRASALADQEDIDEQTKAKFIARLVREFCNNREREKQIKIREQFEKEVELNIYQRFPGLTQNGSPPQKKESIERSRRMKDQFESTATTRISPNKFRNLQNSTMSSKQQQVKGSTTARYNTKPNDLFEIHEVELSGIRMRKDQDSYQSSQTRLRPPALQKVNHFKSAKKPTNKHTMGSNTKSNMNNQLIDNDLIDYQRKAPIKNYVHNYQSQRGQPISKNTKQKMTKRNQDDMPPQQEQWIGENEDQFF
eukprot:403360849